MAINCNNFPQIGKVIALASNANLESVLSVEWLQQERNLVVAIQLITQIQDLHWTEVL